MHRKRLVLAAVSIAAVTSAMVTAPASAAPIPDYSCPSGDVCFYTGKDGTGSRCNWDVDDPDWQGGNIKCSWSGTTNVKSIWNRSSKAVDYYKKADYKDRVGCTKSSIAGNLAGTYKLRSHKFRSGSGC